MCFSANMSMGFGLIGLAASTVTFLDKNEAFWVKTARAYAIFHFSLMEFIQYFAYPVADQCGYGLNLTLSELSRYHICLQAFAIMPALATYSSDPRALKNATLIGATLSSLFLICSFLPKEWQLLDAKPNFIGNLISCLFMGKFHIGYWISSAYGTFVTHGSFFCAGIERLYLEGQPQDRLLSFYNGDHDALCAAVVFQSINRRSRRYVLLLLDSDYRQLHALFQVVFPRPTAMAWGYAARENPLSKQTQQTIAD